MSKHIEDRLDAMLAPLRDHHAQLDEIAQARVRARLETALARGDVAAEVNATQRLGRARVAAVAGAAAVAVLVIVAVRGRSPQADKNAGTGGPVPLGRLAAPAVVDRSASDRLTGAMAKAAADVTPGAGHASPTGVGKAVPASSASAATKGSAGSNVGATKVAITAPVTVVAGASAQLNVGDAAVTVYGPGRLSPTSDGAVAEAPSILVDRAQSDRPWSVRFHGVKIVATQAVFAATHQADVGVTVMRGEITLICPSGTRTIRAGASGSCEPATKPQIARPRVTARTPPSSSPAQPPVPDVPADPAVRSAEAYHQAEVAMRGELDAAHDALLAVIDTRPDSLDAATALLYLARMAAVRGDVSAAFDYLARLDRHPHGAELTTPVANLRVALARYANIQSLKP